MSLDCNMLHASRVGMLYLKNLQTAMEMEAIVRDNGAIPATIAILDGVPHVGQFSASSRAVAGLPSSRILLVSVSSFLHSLNLETYFLLLKLAPKTSF